MKNWHAIAAMAQNRVIGIDNKLPWHLPEDFKWFKAKTMGNTLVMGRKTYESIGKPLAGRETIILSRKPSSAEGVRYERSIESLTDISPEKNLFFCGGAQVYKQILPYCENLFLTVVNAQPEGDTRFPEFENTYKLEKILAEHADFSILHYRNKSPMSLKCSDL